jgi:hypothetical protein
MVAAKKIVDLPEVDFAVSTQGITIYSERFNEPRFLEWDQKGRCGKCRTNAADVDFYVDSIRLFVTIKIYSSRYNNPRFVFFDLPYALPGVCQFRVRMKGQSYLIPFENTLPPIKEEPENTIATTTANNPQDDNEKTFKMERANDDKMKNKM